jgi:hypothetical protein
MDQAQIELIAVIKIKCEEISALFRSNLVEAIDQQGKPIYSVDGTVLKSASADQMIKFIEKISSELWYESGPNSRACAPADTYTIDLSYLHIADQMQSRALHSPMCITFKGSIFEQMVCPPPANLAWKCFDLVVFKQQAIFYINAFKDVSFHNARFESETKFEQINFNGSTDFSEAIFVQGANFSKSTFHSDSNFTNSTFHKKTSFSGASFNYVDFSSAHFYDELDCSNIRFNAKTCFSNTRFTKPLWLHEAIMHQDTSFHNATFSSFKTEEDWRAYRTLKLIMGSFRATEEEGRFFAYEQRTRCNLLRQKNRFSITGNLSWVYDLMSDYGENIAKPLVGLAIINACFVGFYYIIGGIALTNATNSWLSQIHPAIGLGIQSMLNPLGLFSKSTYLTVMNPWVALFSIIQSILSLSAAALLLLAIRRRFHKGNGQ